MTTVKENVSKNFNVERSIFHLASLIRLCIKKKENSLLKKSCGCKENADSNL